MVISDGTMARRGKTLYSRIGRGCLASQTMESGMEKVNVQLCSSEEVQRERWWTEIALNHFPSCARKLQKVSLLRTLMNLHSTLYTETGQCFNLTYYQPRGIFDVSRPEGEVGVALSNWETRVLRLSFLVSCKRIVVYKQLSTIRKFHVTEWLF